MSSYVLYTLRDLRIDGERQAERALAAAAATRRRADEETARLETRVAEARAARRAARENAGVGLDAQGTGSAADAQARLRFWSRLDAEARACTLAVASHRQTAVEPAVRAEAEARAGHLRARQRREVVDKAIARREAAGRLDQSRRAEAAADDLASRRRRD